MKIAYLIHWNEGPSSGVFKKVLSQVTAWSELGHEVSLFLYTHHWEPDWNREFKSIPLQVQSYRGGLRRFTDFRRLLAEVRRWEPDVLYHRYDLYYPGLPALLRQIPSVLEVNTNDLPEMRAGGKFRYGYHRLTRSAVLKAASGFVFVSAEMADEAHFSKYVRDKIIIGNGVDLSGVEPSPVEKREGIRVIFIGTHGQSWHGVDEIAKLAAARPDWHFDLVGIYASHLDGPAPDNMVFHGNLMRSEYEPLMRQADVAIGTLALYRKQMGEASPLKVREYLAYGLPVVIGYKDTDFPEPVPFILQLRNEPDSIAAVREEIEAFVAAWRGSRVERAQISHLDTAVKEAERVRYMERMVREGGRR
ncbi:glycosyltransferase [Paenibacillus aceti]|uniref:Glycosyltransferase subfamily 4-like N-terminal domain-containing protein n=1 Tax=Paenibacillus aceti TaxID=1820010 RepID=A0ABQ1VUX1_9BACL|nr:glycosyltransferase [Paenibacillus aceti]GGG00504.1 hypothetical protein GCM10010913_22840 [Paenibacillus aceti]